MPHEHQPGQHHRSADLKRGKQRALTGRAPPQPGQQGLGFVVQRHRALADFAAADSPQPGAKRVRTGFPALKALHHTLLAQPLLDHAIDDQCQGGQQQDNAYQQGHVIRSAPCATG